MDDLEKLMESVSEKANEVVALREDRKNKEFEIMEGDIDDYVLNYCPNCGSKNEFKEEH